MRQQPAQTIEELFDYRPDTVNLMIAGIPGKFSDIKQGLADLPGTEHITKVTVVGIKQYSDITCILDNVDLHGLSNKLANRNLTIYFVEVDDPFGQKFDMLDEVLAIEYFRAFDSVDFIYFGDRTTAPSRHRIKRHGEYLGMRSPLTPSLLY